MSSTPARPAPAPHTARTRRRLPAASLAALALALVAAFGLTSCDPGAAYGQRAVTAARKQLGQPYRSGGESRAEGGFDCSGLTYYAWNQAAGISIPRSSSAQHAWADRITKSQLRPGDLVFYSADGPRGTVSHVALYSGDGKIIQARKPGIALEERDMDSYWPNNLVGYGRVPADALP